jgi:cell division GTPase FtsZ
METTQNKVNETGISISLKFGFLGLGMGGCSIAAECAGIQTNQKNLVNPYTAILINTNIKDFEKIKHRKNAPIHQVKLEGYEGGAGRDITRGEQAFVKNNDKILESVKANFSDRDFIWIVAGLGGGTGTGSIIEAIKLLHTNGFSKRFGLILTLPRDNEGGQVLGNALERLQAISRAMKGLGSILVVDNQKLYNEYMANAENQNNTIEDFLKYCNSYVAETLHGINVVTGSYAPYGDTYFDASEFENLIKTPGFISLSKLQINNNEADLENESTFVTKVKASIEKGVLSDGYNFNSTDRAAVSIVANENTAKRLFTLPFRIKMEDILDGYVPNASEKPVATYVDPRTNLVSFYMVFSGLGFPKRITEIIEKNKQYEEAKNQKENDDVLDALSSFSRKKTIEEDFDLTSALGESTSSSATKNETNQEDDLLDLLK